MQINEIYTEYFSPVEEIYLVISEINKYDYASRDGNVLTLAEESPDQYAIIDARQDIDGVESDVREAIASRFM